MEVLKHFHNHDQYMSVWKTNCYRDDVLERLTRTFKPSQILTSSLVQAADLNVEDFGEFDVPKNLKPGNLKDQLLDEQVKLHDLYNVDAEIFIFKEKDNFFSKFEKTNEIHKGIDAVHEIAHKILTDDPIHRKLSRNEVDIIQAMFMLGTAGSYMGPKIAVANFRKQKMHNFLKLRQLDVIKRYLLHFKVVSGNKRHNMRYTEMRTVGNVFDEYVIPDNVDNLFPGANVIPYNGLIYISYDDMYNVYIFTPNDLDRIYQIVRGVLLYDVSANVFQGTNAEGLVRQIRKLFINSLHTVKDHNSLCKIWDIIYHYSLSHYASDINTNSLNLQRNKFLEADGNSAVPLSTIISIVEHYKMKDVLDLLNIYKCLPVADFDYFGAMERQRIMYSTPNHFMRIDNSEYHKEDFLKYYRYMMIRAYHKKHGVCPGKCVDPIETLPWTLRYPHIHPRSMNYREVFRLDITGCFNFTRFGTDILDHVRDSAIMPVNVPKHGFDLAKMKQHEKNMLLDMMQRGTPINTRRYTNENSYLDVKAEDKPEAKKPDGRWFFELNTDARVKHSEYEEAISEYISFIPGCITGLPKEKLDKKMSRLRRFNPDMYNIERKDLIISFDLHRFSPHYPAVLHELIDVENADMFGNLDFLHESNVHTKGKIHYFKKGIHHVMQKPRSDFEGMSGKLNTVIHAALMGYTVAKLREDDLVMTGAEFAVLIDDGLLKLSVNPKRYDEYVPKILQVIEDTYKNCGFEISWDKTIVSENVSIFLHDIYFEGRNMQSIIKTFLKIDNHADVPIADITADFEYLGATVNAAIKVGCDLFTAYLVYCYMFFDVIRKWSDKVDKLNTLDVAWFFAPYGLGGFSAMTALQVASSLEYDRNIGWLAVIEQIRNRYKIFNPAFHKILNQELEEKYGLNAMVTRNAFRRKDRILNAFRMERMLENVVLGLASASVRTLIMNYEKEDISDLILTAVHTDVVGMARTRMYEMTLASKLSAIVKKFLRSRTVVTIAGKKRAGRIKHANRVDVAIVLDTMIKLHK